MKISLLIIFTFIITAAFSQTIRFNKTYIDTTPTTRNITVLDTGYVIMGGGGSPLYILTVYIDINGNLIWMKKIRNSNYYLFHGFENSLQKTKDSLYILAGTKVKINSNQNEILLIKFNRLFDTIWTKTFLRDTIYIDSQGCSLSEDGGYVLVGQRGINDSDSEALLIKTDSAGNMQWYRTYGGWSFDYSSKITKTNTGGFLLGGYTRSFSSGIPQYDAGEWYIVKTDSSGNQLWQNHYGNPDYDDGSVVGLITTRDSGYIITGNIVYYNFGPGANYRRGRIIRFDKNLNVVWDKQYLLEGTTSGCGSVIELEDGSLVVLGGVYDEEPNYFLYGKLLKLKANGDVIWERAYHAYPSVIDNMSFTQTFAVAPDNGFAIIGYCTNSYVTPGQRMWLVKTDCKGYEKPPVANYNYLQNLKTITCFNHSQNVDSCFWNFGDGSPLLFTTATDTVQHTYTDTGTFAVKMIVYNGCTVLDNDTVTQTVYIAGTYSEYQEWLERTVHIYPNPAKETVTVSMLEYEPAEIVLFDMQGKAIFSVKSNEKKTAINISNLDKGVYTVKIQTAKGIVVRKLVKE